jgi:hypothetical protein
MRAVLLSAAAAVSLGAAAPQLAQHVLPDPYLKLTAWTFLAPHGWSVAGGVSWNPKGSPWYNTVLTVRNPRGSEEYHRFPTFMFAQTGNPVLANGAEIRPVLDPVQAILQVLAPRCRPEVQQLRVVASEPLPRLADSAVAEARAFSLPLLRAGSARVHVEYLLGGRPMEEMLYCTTASFQMRGLVSWMIDKAFSYRAEKGRLREAFPLLGTIAASLAENPQWVAARRQAMARMVAAATRPPATAAGRLSILDVSRSMARDQDSFLKGLDSSFSARLNSPGLNAWSEAYRGVQTLHNPATGRAVTVENGYQRYFQDNLGRIYGSNDRIGDPYVNYKISATELNP